MSFSLISGELKGTGIKSARDRKAATMARKHTPKAKAGVKKGTEYPTETKGSRMAAKLRKRANALTDEEREGHFHAGMSIIYGGQQAVGARR
jgi:hypothetical protein